MHSRKKIRISLKYLGFLALFLGTLTIQAKDYVIEDHFVVSLPDESTVKPRPEGATPNAGYPKIQGPGFQFMTYWWNWVEPEIPLLDVPGLWLSSRPGLKAQNSDLHPFTTNSGLDGARFHTFFPGENAPLHTGSHWEMLLLRDSRGKAVLFQMSGDPAIIEKAFKSLRFTGA